MGFLNQEVGLTIRPKAIQVLPAIRRMSIHEIKHQVELAQTRLRIKGITLAITPTELASVMEVVLNEPNLMAWWNPASWSKESWEKMAVVVSIAVMILK